PQIGEFLKVGGTTDPSFFAPIVNASQLDTISAGHLPEPLHPTWDQLLNGSLDAQFVEIQGLITTVGTNGVTLLTRDGRINLELRVVGMQPEKLADYEDALVRIRGCLFASWDYVTHKVKMGEIRIYGASLSVDQPAPADLFAIPAKTAAELLLFDPQAGVFQRVKVNGQILYVHDPEYFMTDGTSGLRFIAKKSLDLKAGDTVDVVGFPELSGASPLLREAVARKVGETNLPTAKNLSSADLIHADYDATLVRVKGTLSGIRQTGSEQTLEIQNGVRTFVARLSGHDPTLDSLPVGSLLELTGVYAGQGGNKAIGQDISSFELFLNSTKDIKVLARPPWWTLERLLVIVGALAIVLVITVLWITQLHRKVEERTRQLEAQIRERQFAEQQRAIEQERARVAQDLHDELGSGLTEVSMLVTLGKSVSTAENGTGQHLKQIGERADQMVTALDEIVWAMNPKHDSLASLVSYSCLYADRFLKLANIGCRLKGGVDMPDRMVSSTYRHEFFLAFKEALTNVVRHSGATEVRLGVQMIGQRLRLSIADNGGGLAENISKEGSDGLVNMRMRLEKMGGRFEIASKAGRGTTLRFYMPLY
ncbi:MAG TPA: ATP-binding protein, partial [Verrucomicrobiae bacterium]|nr:ATP-binding protein [Verrucomicrobiae bacterium]